MNLNRVDLIGRAGGDPKLTYATSGKAVANVSIATTDKWKKDGESHEATEWHRVTFWGKLAEIAGEYLKKGALVYVSGKIKYGSYEDKDGHKVYTTDIYASEMILLGGKLKATQVDPQALEGQGSDDSLPF